VLVPTEVAPIDELLPRLVVDLPGWGAPEVTEAAPPSADVGQDRRRVDYQGADGLIPMIEVLTTTGDHGLGFDNTAVEVAGHDALLSPRYEDGTQFLGWLEDGLTMALMAIEVPEDQLLAAAETLVNIDGAWELATPPPGLAEVHRTDPEAEAAGGGMVIRYPGPDGSSAELTMSTSGVDEVWGLLTEAVFEGLEAKEVSVHGQLGLLNESDDGHRVDWLEREGMVAMRLQLRGLTRDEIDEVLGALTDVDVATWRELTGPGSGGACADTSDTIPAPCTSDG
jgi:hypothetical protein